MCVDRTTQAVSPALPYFFHPAWPVNPFGSTCNCCHTPHFRRIVRCLCRVENKQSRPAASRILHWLTCRRNIMGNHCQAYHSQLDNRKPPRPPSVGQLPWLEADLDADGQRFSLRKENAPETCKLRPLPLAPLPNTSSTAEPLSSPFSPTE